MIYEIKAAKPSDGRVVHEMILELARFEHAEHEVESTPETIDAQLSMNVPPFRCLIARVDGQPVGFALYFQSYSTWRGKPGLWLEDLYVRPNFRGLGIGKAMFQQLVYEVEAMDGGRLEWPVLEWNRDAQQFYKNQGALPLNEWRTWRLNLPRPNREG